MSSVRTLVAVLLVLLASSGLCLAAEGRPSVLIPATDSPPKIDGRIEPAEWADAAVITGFIQPQSSLLTPPGGAVYIKHDAERLYLAFHCTLLPGMTPTRRHRRRDDPVYMDSHQIELWLTPPVDDAKTWAHQFIGNAYGAIFDNLQHPELGSTSTGWNGNWQFKNRFEKGKYWDAELSISARDLNMAGIKAGQVWRGLVGIAWPQRSWPFTGGWYKNVPLHADWVMGADAAAVRLTGVDNLLADKLDLTASVAAGSRGGVYTAEARIGDLRLSKTIELRPGERKSISLRKALPAGDGKGRVLKLTVSGPGGRVLFRGQWNFKPGVKPAGRRPREKEKPFPAEVNYAAEAKAIRFWADVLDYPKRDRLKSVRVVVSPKGRPDRTKADLTVSRFDYDQVEGYSWLGGDLPVGQYDVRFDFLDAAGKVMDTNSKSFRSIDLAKTFHWWNTPVGTRYTAKPGFQPITVDGKRLSVWGRTIDLGAGAFPASITSQGAQMLARPIALVVETDAGKDVCRPRDVRITAASGTKVTFEGSFRGEAIAATVKGQLEFDGTMLYDLSITPRRRGVRVQRVYLSMALKPAHAMYYHTTAGGWSGAYDFVPARPATQPFWTSKGFADFVPYVGFSDDDRALQWFADNDHTWVIGSDYPCVELYRREKEVELQVNLVRKSGVLQAIKGVRFGLIATPVKPMRRGWRNLSLHFGRLCNARTAFFYGAGHGGGLSLHDSAGLLKVLGVKVPPGKSPDEVLAGVPAGTQGKVQGLTSLADGVINCPFQNAQMLFEGYRSKAFATLFAGDWRRYPPGGWFHLTPTRSYQDFFMWHLDTWVKHISVRGIYFDEVYFPTDANVFNASGKVMPDGSIRPSVNLMHQRAFMRRVRQVFVDRGVEPFIWVHTSNFMAPHAISSCQVAMFGEDRAPTATTDYIDTAGEILFRSIGRSQKFGLAPIWMNQVGRGGGTAKGPLHRMARQVCGWCWMFDTNVELHTVSRGRAQQWLRVHWGIGADDVKYHPYWRQALVRTADKDVIVSVWTRPGSALLQVFNLARTGRKARLTLAPAALGLKRDAKVYDLESLPALAALKRQLRAYDAGTIKGQAEIRTLHNACRTAGAEPYKLGDLKVVGGPQGVRIDIPPRDFVLLVAE